MSSGLYSGVSGLAIGSGLYKGVSSLWSGASGLVTGWGGGGGGYSPEAEAYFAAMVVQPDATRKTLLNNLIVALVSGGVWAKLDWLAIHAMHDSQAARINAKNPAQLATAVNSPTFTTDRGFTGDGVTSYLNTNVNASTAGGLYLQNSCHMGAWVGTDVDNFSQYDFGMYTAGNCGRSVSNAILGPQTGTNVNLPLGTATSVGHTSWSRTGSTTVRGYKNGSGTSFTNTSTALRNAPALICAISSSTTGTASPALRSTRRIQATHFGGSLSDAEMLALYNALSTYMTAVGA